MKVWWEMGPRHRETNVFVFFFFLSSSAEFGIDNIGILVPVVDTDPHLRHRHG